MVTNSCKDCTERHVGCHSDCEKYLKFVEENEKLKAIKRKNQPMRLNSNGTMYTPKKGR